MSVTLVRKLAAGAVGIALLALLAGTPQGRAIAAYGPIVFLFLVALVVRALWPKAQKTVAAPGGVRAGVEGAGEVADLYLGRKQVGITYGQPTRVATELVVDAPDPLSGPILLPADQVAKLQSGR